MFLQFLLIRIKLKLMKQKKNKLYTHPQALAAGSLTTRTSRSTKGGPTILAPPRVRLIGVPRGAIGTHGSQIPIILLRIVEMVGGAYVRRALPRAARPASPTIALAVVGRRTVVRRGAAVAVLAATDVAVTSPTTGLAAALLSGHRSRRV